MDRRGLVLAYLDDLEGRPGIDGLDGLAEATGIHKNTLSKWRNDPNVQISRASLLALARSAGVNSLHEFDEFLAHAYGSRRDEVVILGRPKQADGEALLAQAVNLPNRSRLRLAQQILATLET